jgi:hypothetical protein
MSRAALALDRLVALLLGLALVVVGVAAAAWGTQRVDLLPDALDLGPVVEASDKSWWPWATGVGGAVLILLGLRWLFAHVPRSGAGPIRLPGTDRTGRLTAETGPVATAAAAAFADTPGVRSVRGRVMRDRGQTLVRLVAAIDPAADLTAVGSAADDVATDLRHTLGRHDIRCRVHLHISRRTAVTRPRIR